MKLKKASCTLCLACTALLVLSCGKQPDRRDAAAADDPVALAHAVTQEYVDGYFNQFPEEAYWQGYPNSPRDRLGDHSLAALDAVDCQWGYRVHRLLCHQSPSTGSPRVTCNVLTF